MATMRVQFVILPTHMIAMDMSDIEVCWQMRCVPGSTAARRYWRRNREKARGLQGKCFRVNIDARALLPMT